MKYRLVKYANRGFKIVLPYLNIKKLNKNGGKCYLPYLPFTYKKILNNIISIDEFNLKECDGYDIGNVTNERVNIINISNNSMTMEQT